MITSASPAGDSLAGDVDLLTGLHDQVLREAGQGELVTLVATLREATTRAAARGDQHEPSRIIDTLDVVQAGELARALTCPPSCDSAPGSAATGTATRS